MLLIAGLGNPGIEYEKTPHNLGFMTIDRLAEDSGITVKRPEGRSLVGRGQVENTEVVLAKPLCYMNNSGVAIKALLEKYGLTPAELIVVYDDINLPWRSVRVRERGSAGGHNGMKSIIAELGTQEFTRVRLGVEPELPVDDSIEYLLSPFRRSQKKDLEELIGRGAEAVRSILAEGAAKAMTRFNRRAQGQNTEEK